MRNKVFPGKWISGLALLGLASLLFLACGNGAKPGGKGGADEPQSKADKLAEAKQLLKQGMQAEKKGEFEDAESSYARAHKLRPGHFETAERYVGVLIKRRQFEKAIEVANKFLNRAPDESRRYHLLADAQIAASEWVPAYETLTQLIDLDGANASAYAKRGTVQSMRDDFDKAKEDLGKALEIEPENADFHAWLGGALLRARRINEARVELNSAIQLDPDNLRAHIFLGKVLREQEDFEGAVAAHEKAVKLAPDSAEAHFELGLTQNYAGDNAGAEINMKKATELAPEDAVNWYAYGEVLRAMGRNNEAAPQYRKALELDPEHPKAANKLGKVLYDAGNFEEAEAVLTERVRKHPDDSDTYFHLGVTYGKQEKYKLAVEALEKFLQVAPSGTREIAEAKKYVRDWKRKVRYR